MSPERRQQRSLPTLYVDYQVDGIAQEPREASVSRQVDHKVGFVLAETGAAPTTVISGESGAVTALQLTNQANAPLTIFTSGSLGFALHDLSFCPPPTGLWAEKQSEPLNPASSFVIPRNEVIYTVNVANTGEVSAAPDSLSIVDAMPSGLAFFNSDYDGAGPAATSLGLAQTGSGMTFKYSADVALSNAASALRSFSGCTYTPTVGHDPNVRFRARIQ